MNSKTLLEEDEGFSTNRVETKEELLFIKNKHHLVRRPCFLLLSGLHAGRLVVLNFGQRDSLVIGRGEDCDLLLDNPDISRHHAKLEQLSDGSILLQDLNSTNGSFVNNRGITGSYRLQAADKVQFGRYGLLKLLYQDQEEMDFYRKLYNNSTHDCLTAIVNRRYFFDSLQREWSFAKRHELQLSLALLDIDHFKKVNDTHGHLVGDQVLKEFVSRIKGEIRCEDLFARYGGEEFAILLRQTNETELWNQAERMRRCISSTPFLINGISIDLTVSIGLSTFSNEQILNSKPRQLLGSADNHLYQAKMNGRNCICYPSKKPRSRSRSKSKLKSEAKTETAF